MRSQRQAHALMHLTVLTWGFTAILGRLISMPAISLVWYRLLIVVAVMAGIVQVRGIRFFVPRSALRLYALVGVLISCHWLLFYGCIKYAGIAVAVLCLASATLFTAFIEPFLFRRSIRPSEIAIGLLVVAGVSFLVKVEANSDALGLAMGLGSALLAASFGTLNGKLAREARRELVTFYELSVAAFATALFFAFRPGDFVPFWEITTRDLALLGALAIFCTVFPWLWSLRVLETLSPYTFALAVSLEPVYAMSFAWFLFPGAERLSYRFYLGTALLLALVVANNILNRPRAAGSHRAAASLDS